jgi:hypothetical protein
MRSIWALFVGIALLITIIPPAHAALNFADDVCPDTGGTEFIVDTAPKAARVENGYSVTSCTIIIKISLNPTDNNYIIKAKAISIEGDGVNPLDIINSAPGGDINLQATGGNILVTNASVKARDFVRLQCGSANCRIDVDDSSIIGSPTLDQFNIPGDPGSGFVTKGEVFISAKGDVDLQRSDIFGGSGLHIESQQGKVTWFCPGPGASGCIDPFAKPFKALELCPDPADPTKTKFPCTVNFADAAALKAVCFPGTPGRFCGGGATEIRVTAQLDLDISGTTIIALDHLTLDSKKGGILAGPKNGQPSVINVADSFAALAFKTIDMREAEWTAATIKVTSGGGCVAADAGFCINAEKSILTANNIRILANNKNGDINACAATMTAAGSDFPALNLDNSAPYDPNVVDTAAECAPLAPLAAF